MSSGTWDLGRPHQTFKVPSTPDSAVPEFHRSVLGHTQYLKSSIRLLPQPQIIAALTPKRCSVTPVLYWCVESKACGSFESIQYGSRTVSRHVVTWLGEPSPVRLCRQVLSAAKRAVTFSTSFCQSAASNVPHAVAMLKHTTARRGPILAGWSTKGR